VIQPERVALLVAALESDRFKQTHAILTRRIIGNDMQEVDAHCCLGVACIVAAENGLDLDIEQKTNAYDRSVKVFYDGRVDVLPGSVREWFGFNVEDPMLRRPAKPRVWYKPWTWKYSESEPVSAVHANDELRLSFKDIARAFRYTYLNK
jgi:hypothetical protein